MGLGSGIRKKPIPDPGVKKAPDPGSGSATLCTVDIPRKAAPVRPLRRIFRSADAVVYPVQYGYNVPAHLTQTKRSLLKCKR